MHYVLKPVLDVADTMLNDCNPCLPHRCEVSLLHKILQLWKDLADYACCSLIPEIKLTDDHVAC